MRLANGIVYFRFCSPFGSPFPPVPSPAFAISLCNLKREKSPAEALEKKGFRRVVWSWLDAELCWTPRHTGTAAFCWCPSAARTLPAATALHRSAGRSFARLALCLSAALMPSTHTKKPEPQSLEP